ncbi:hypothetical protein [Actinomadura sp. WMMA1423]|uniref:hypothetical protein n=1 Tax=Actinomadura sp. WMMA1423 TaxID=2591108 RepID=UPI0011467C5E|nr:hypothetical protein [Actinomadura sp. WMMA1423]
MQKIFSKAAATLGTAVLVTGSAAGAATAENRPSAPAAEQGRTSTTTHCAYVLDRLRPGETSSRILRKGCAPSKKELDGAMGTTADTLLLVMYEDANYGGSTKAWYGKYGPCDSEGYGIRDLETTLWNINDKISSWKIGHSRCNYVNMWENASYGGRHAAWKYYTAVPYVGDQLNDRISSVHVHYEP